MADQAAPEDAHEQTGATHGNPPTGSSDGPYPADPYAALARWYDLEHDDFTVDLEAYQALLADLLGGQGSILELGSGTGRLLAGLAVLGYRVRGIEPSSAMRALATRRVASLPERVGRRITQVAGDASTLNLPGGTRFDAALYGLNTLAHLLTRTERIASFRAVAAHLSPGGFLVLDLDLRGPRTMARALGKEWSQGVWPLPSGPTGAEVRHWVSARAVEQGALTLDHRYEVWLPGDTELPTQRVSVPMRLALLDPAEIIAELTEVGYALDAHYGDYDLRRPTARSPRALLIAHRDESAV